MPNVYALRKRSGPRMKVMTWVNTIPSILSNGLGIWMAATSHRHARVYVCVCDRTIDDKVPRRFDGRHRTCDRFTHTLAGSSSRIK